MNENWFVFHNPLAQNMKCSKEIIISDSDKCRIIEYISGSKSPSDQLLDKLNVN